MNDSQHHDADLSSLHEELRAAPEYVVHQMMDQIRYQLRRRLEERGAMTQTALAEAMGVKPPVVNRLLRAAENTSLLTIARAARALDLEFCTFKLVPAEEAGAQVDEFSKFLRSERGWWPSTRKPGAPYSGFVCSHAAKVPAFGYLSREHRPATLSLTVPANEYTGQVAADPPTLA